MKFGKRLQKGFALLMIVSLVFVAACGGNSGTSGEPSGSQASPSQSASSSAPAEGDKKPIKIGVLASMTGALQAYGEQTTRGFDIGLDYATDGTRTVAGRPIEYIVEDTETKPDVALQKATKLLENDKVDFLVGSSSSGDTLAVLPILEEYQKIMIVEPAVADAITGANWNKYVFRTARNSSQDAVAGAAAIAKPGVTIATLAQDSAFGRDGIKAFKAAAEKLGAKIILEEYADPNATDYTANIQKIIQAKPEYLYVVWAGSHTPWKQLRDMKIQELGIKISTGAPDIAALRVESV